MNHLTLLGRADGCLLGFELEYDVAQGALLYIDSVEHEQPRKSVTLSMNDAELEALARLIERARDRRVVNAIAKADCP